MLMLMLIFIFIFMLMGSVFDICYKFYEWLCRNCKFLDIGMCRRGYREPLRKFGGFEICWLFFEGVGLIFCSCRYLNGILLDFGGYRDTLRCFMGYS